MASPSAASSGDRPRRPPFWVAAGFIVAFGATIATVVLTGLFVRAPGSGDESARFDTLEPESAGPREAAEAVRGDVLDAATSTDHSPSDAADERGGGHRAEVDGSEDDQEDDQ